MERIYNHRVRQDLLDLSKDLNALPLASRAQIAFATVYDGLMYTKLSVKIQLKLLALRYGAAAPDVLGREMAARKPEAAEDIWKSVLRHMVSGRDTFDRTSAGGWCAKELNSFLQIAGKHGWNPQEAAPEPEASGGPKP